MTKISCVYNRTASGRLSLAFAADLWKSLNGSSTADAARNANPSQNQLQIFLQVDESGAAILSDIGAAGEASASVASGVDDPDTIIGIEQTLVEADVVRKTALCQQSLALRTAIDSDAIIVDHNLAFQRHDLTVLYPCRETTLLGRGRGPIMVPFGDGDSVLNAAALAFELAGQLQLPVVLYHTTWSVQGLTSAEPQDHMCQSARAVLATLLKMAQATGVECTTVVETADDVVEGLLQCALRHSTRLIVMSRSYKTTVGCYVDQTLRQTPIPLVALASPKRRAS